MKHLSLVVDNSLNFFTPTSYSQIAKVIDFGYSSFSEGYQIWWVNSSGQEGYHSFNTEYEMFGALDEIKDLIAAHNERIKDIKLVVSNPLSWLDLAKERVAKGISATKKHRAAEHRNAMRDVTR